MLNWINFFRKPNLTAISSDVLFSVYEYLNSFRPDTTLSNNSIFEKVGCNYKDFVEIVYSLDEEKIVKFTPRCIYCQNVFNRALLEDSMPECEKCKEYVSITSMEDAIVLLISGQTLDSIFSYSYELNAALLAEAACKFGYLYYLNLDIEGSQSLQRSDSGEYSVLVKKIWKEVMREALIVCKRVYLPLMTKGDACVIAFIDKDDVFHFLKKLARLIYLEKYRFCGYLERFEFANEDRLHFVRTLENTWDFNTNQVTEFHRWSSVYKPDYWKSLKDYSIKMCVLEGFVKAHPLSELLSDKSSYTDTHTVENKGLKYTRRYTAFAL